MNSYRSLYNGPMGLKALYQLISRRKWPERVSSNALLKVLCILGALLLAQTSQAQSQSATTEEKQPTLPANFKLKDLYPAAQLTQLQVEQPQKYAQLVSFFDTWDALPLSTQLQTNKRVALRLFIHDPAGFQTLIND